VNALSSSLESEQPALSSDKLTLVGVHFSSTMLGQLQVRKVGNGSRGIEAPGTDDEFENVRVPVIYPTLAQSFAQRAGN
jgi:hypothetical protein